jgi:PEGA domain
MPRLATLVTAVFALPWLLVGCPPGEKPDVTPADATEAAVDEGSAFMTVNTKPWSTVFLDGEIVGNTPKKKYPIPAGDHDLAFKCGPCVEEEGYAMKFSVEEGQTYTNVDQVFAGAVTLQASKLGTSVTEDLPPPVEPYEGEDAAYMTLNSKPWSHIILDDGTLGNTPKKRLAITPGSHTVELLCGPCAEPQSRTLTFTVNTGETYTSVRNEFTP